MRIEASQALRNGTSALKEAAARLDDLLAAKGVTEDELVADFKRWRAGKRRRPQAEGSYSTRTS